MKKIVLVAALAACVLVLGGLLAWQLWPTSNETDTQKACAAAIDAQANPEGGGGPNVPVVTVSQVRKVDELFHKPSVSDGYKGLADQALERISVQYTVNGHTYKAPQLDGFDDLVKSCRYDGYHG